MLERLRQFLKRSKFYRCRHCGYVLPKEKAVVSGWDCQQSLRHVHCHNCGRIITQVP